MRTTNRRRMATTAVAALLGVTGLAACGDDGDGSSSAACDASVAIDQEVSVNEDLEAGIAAIEDFVAAAPDDVADRVAPLVPLLRDDPEAAFESEEIVAAETAVDDYSLENCGDTEVDLEALNFAFPNAPTELSAGRVVFNLTNESQTGEAHEALLLRKNDDVDGSAHDVIAAAIEGQPVSVETTFGALEQFTLVNAGLAEPEGGDTQDVFLADLEPGEYILVCMLPVDSAELGEAYFSGEAVDGTYHFDEGMFAEFTVE